MAAKEETGAEEKATKAPRYEWYQNDAYVVITIFVKGIKEDYLYLTCDGDSLDFQGTDENGDVYTTKIPLAHKVRESVDRNVMKTKLEVKLSKSEGVRWETLERKEPPSSSSQSAKPKGPAKWNELEKEVKKEEEEEKPEGDAALMKLFQDLYGKGTDEQKQAMIKSFYESGGTVLSTNWEEVKEKPVDVQPPDGMEFKKWTPS